MARKKTTSSSESFTEDYVSWDNPNIPNRRGLDKTLGETRGGNASTGLDFTIESAEKRLQVGNLNADTRKKLTKDISVATRLRKSGVVQDTPTTISHISKQFEGLFNAGIQRGIEGQTQIPGAGWYFEHRRSQKEAVAPEANLTNRQLTAMGGKLSSGKTPADELASLGGISHLVSTHQGKMMGGRAVRDIPSAELGELASTASSWNAYNESLKTDKRLEKPAQPQPVFDDKDLESSMVNAGRAHKDNVIQALSVARGEVSPKEAFRVSTTPKTAAYAEMQAQSDPDSVVEGDYRNVAAHLRDVTAGKVSKDQGMFVFSQEEGAERPHALSSRAPTAIDTWMIAAGSGQPLWHKDTTAEGKETGRGISPAKRLVDKGFPLDPTGYGKRRLGLEGTDVSITPEAVVSAQHNEAIRRVSENRIGPISFDQFGKEVFTPSSLIQEVVWTEARKQAGADKEYNKEQRESVKESKNASREAKKAEKAQANLNKDQLKLF